MDLYKPISWDMGLGVERARAALHRQIKNDASRLCIDACTQDQSAAHHTPIVAALARATLATADHVLAALPEVA
jgi:hypothetical protein